LGLDRLGPVDLRRVHAHTGLAVPSQTLACVRRVP
jgi:hypothetical protein